MRHADYKPRGEGTSGAIKTVEDGAHTDPNQVGTQGDVKGGRKHSF